MEEFGKRDGSGKVSAELIRRARLGDEDALYELLKTVEKPLYRRAYYFLGHPEEALDATQEALLRVYLRLSEFRGESAFETWAVRIVTNVCLDRLRGRANRPKEAEAAWEGMRDASADVEAEVLAREAAATLSEALRRLPPHHRVPLLLRLWDGWSYEEIAEALAVPVGTVKSHVHRARLRLKEVLRPLWTGG